MNKSFLKIGLGLLALAGVVWPSQGAQAGMKTLNGHVPSVVAHLSSLGHLNATNSLHLAIGLPLRNQADANALVQQMYDPSSPNYGKFLSPGDFAAQFGPAEADYQSVINFARTNGFTVVGGHSNRTLVDVVGKVSDIERAFHVSLHTYQHPKESRQFYAPDAEPTVDTNIPVFSVCGLNNYVLPKPLYHRPASKSLVTQHMATGSAPFGNYWGYDFRNAYAPGVSLTGSGQNVALFECDGYFASDISSYITATGLPAVTLTNVLIDGASGQPSGTGGEVEVALDIDMANAMAPGLNEIIVYEAPNDTPAFNLDQLTRIADDDLARQISSSWVIGDSPQFAQIYVQFALQGQSFLQACGDEGAYFPGIFQFEDSPLVTLVGGTTLTSTGPGGVWGTEQEWNWGGGIAGGGGISLVYNIPSWQTNINMTTNMGSTTMRNIPDVALTADDIYIWADGVPQPGVGGTSCAAPLWAGFMSLVNQQLAASGKAPIGFLNPTIYSLAQSPNFVYTNLFHDIVVGNNTNLVQTNLYYAVPGYDLCTGWGTPNGSNLINALTLVAGSVTNNIAAVIPAPKQPWGTSLDVMNGSNPNGFWLLFMQDDTLNNYSGTNYNGWAVNLTTANPVGFPADNQLYVNATNVVIQPGGRWTTTLAVTNYGPATSTNVIVNDLYSSGVSVASWSSTSPFSSVARLGNQLIWTVGANLTVNAGYTLTLNFTNNATGSVFTNGATVTATTYDPNPDDDSVGVSITTTPPVISSRFAFPGGGASAGMLALSMTNDPGVTVVIQASTNLVNWVPVSTNMSPFTFTNFDSTNFQDRFYRAFVPPSTP